MPATAFLVDGAFVLARYRKVRGECDGSLRRDDLADEHFEPDMRQTQVDTKIGIDIAALACKKQVDQSILVAGDADFVPAAKLARCEGIDVILDPMWQGIAPDRHEPIDGLPSVCPRPA